MGSRWFISLFLLVIYVLPAGSTRELLKFPVLAEHYSDHRTENSTIGFTSFLISHYCTENGTDPDADEDRKLPFQSTDQLTYPGTITLSLPENIDMLGHPGCAPVADHLTMDDENIPSGSLDAIWQPPRSC